MMGELDRILEELRFIRDRLDGDVGSEERDRLEGRRDELRAAAQLAMPATTVSVQRVRAELAAAEARLDDLLGRRIDVVRQAGGSLGGDFGFTADAMKINREIDAAQDRKGLETRVRELRSRLRQLEGEDA
jgi:hypothetical protein